MPHYNAPLRDMQFVLFDLLQAESELAALPRHAGLDRETIEAVLEEGAKFASQVIQPLNQVGDREGCTFHGDGVVTSHRRRLRRRPLLHHGRDLQRRRCLHRR